MYSSRLLAVSVLLVACSRSEPPQKEVSASAPAPAAKQAEPPKPSIEDTTFRLALTGKPDYAAGKESAVDLVLEARGGYHVNQEYPIRIDLKAPASVKLPKPSLGRADAAQFGEERARFELPFSADKGTHELLANVDFAVCTKETCVPDQRTLALSLEVH